MNIADDLVSAFNDGYRQGREDAVVRGEWIERAWRPTCSLCGFSESLVDTPISPFKYCPNCGAKMESEGST